MRRLPSQARLARPWRNGGGVTSDIAFFPAGASDETFLWRASLARIDAAGPFSAWSGVDRTLMPLQGELILTFDGAAERHLRPGDSAVGLAGEAAVAARPVTGECTVLNIMVRRGATRARLERWETARPTAADQVLLLAEAATSVRLDGRPVGLGPHDALLLDRAEIEKLESDHALIVAEFFGATEPGYA